MTSPFGMKVKVSGAILDQGLAFGLKSLSTYEREVGEIPIQTLRKYYIHRLDLENTSELPTGRNEKKKIDEDEAIISFSFV